MEAKITFAQLTLLFPISNLEFLRVFRSVLKIANFRNLHSLRKIILKINFS